ncbi:MAG: UDP-4-amino-4,6-dideoxy-N-acetyl-beta-L-altrosamine transaminase [Kiritimatiellia bacterium]
MLKGAETVIPYSRQYIDEQDINAVIDVLKGDWLTCGPKVKAFEEALATQCNAEHAVAVSNGTAALHIACLAAGLKAGDHAVTSAVSFLASANCIEYTGAATGFADIDPETANLSPESLQCVWQPNSKAVVAVDFTGQPCDLPAISEFVKSHGGVVIEDAAHSIGASISYKGDFYKVGGMPWADMTTLSFHPVKTITCGEGGAILTNNRKLADKCRLLRSHGMFKDKNLFQGLGCDKLNEFGPWYYEMTEPGYNYRITDIQCALGLSQLDKLESFIQRRRKIASLYKSLFSGSDMITPLTEREESRSAYHLYPVLIDFNKIRITRTQLIMKLKQQGIGSQVHYIPIPLQPYYRLKYGFTARMFPYAVSYYSKCLSLPLYPSITEDQIVKIAETVLDIVSTNRK